MSRPASKGDLDPSAADVARHKAIAQMFTDRVSTAVGRHALLVLDAQLKEKGSTIRDLGTIARDHYISPESTAQRLKVLGAPKTAALLAQQLPTSKTSRSGDMGEILGTEVAESRLGYRVPVRRLRWKDGRDMALRGNDIIGLARDENAALQILKGESKSRVSLAQAAIDEAAETLDHDNGRPSRHSVLFIAERLRDAGSDALANELDEAVLQSFRGYTVEHLLFAVTGTDPNPLLQAHLETCARKRRRRHAVGIQVNDHGGFVKALYESI